MQMRKFKYQALDQAGQQHKGVLNAASPEQAIENLKSQNLWVTGLTNDSDSLFKKEISLFSGPKVKGAEFTIFCRQLSTLYRSGIGLFESIGVLAEQTSNQAFKKVLLNVYDDIHKGRQFSEAAEAHPEVFNTIFISMIRAGEATGNLDEILNRLAVYYEKEYKIKEKVKSAMVYPVIISILAVVVVIILLAFVIPNLIENFIHMQIELPFVTRMVVGMSAWMQNYWYILLAFLVICPIAFRYAKKNEGFKRKVDHYKLKVPVFGLLWQKQALARLTRTLSSLVKAEVPLLQSMSLVTNVVENVVIADVVKEAREYVKTGQPITLAFEKSWVFPPMVVQMIAVGARSSSLDEMLAKVADFYEDDVDVLADRLKSLIEPLMITALTVVVGIIVLSVMLPSFTLINSMSKMS